jgi:tRNA1(Val) A37 N6-methylase TrmN6
LNSLFFQVLAKKHDERNQDVKQAFEKVAYLNSSLFEPTGIEHATLFISNLRDDKKIPVYASSVLKDENGKKKTGEINALSYLFEFLNAYDFASEGSEEIQEDNKTLINASVLGLIFEKINGYKDGSFFTPGFITMYMCRETIRRAVVQKFNETKNWNIENFEALYDKIEDRTEANNIVDSIKICDPAVGSGHFLVSALNEVLAVKNDLKILQDRSGKRLKEYQLEVVNDELIVTDEEGELFEYNPKNKESQRIQETLFHEKQSIIENCLFGVDINPNSVKICRLRLWIELLKSAYYKNETELETLPNIDINIKCGNSLISRFDLDADLGEALKKSKWNIQSYRLAVVTYRNAENKEQKREMEQLILSIKQSFTTEIRLNDPIKKRLDKVASELYHRFTGTFLFEPETPYGKTEKQLEKQRKTEREKLEKEIEQLNAKIEEIKNNKIYENAFEWRFEFPEVLDDKGNFVGFDVVIGNPPYGMIQNDVDYFLRVYKTFEGRFDLFEAFIERALQIVKKNSSVKYILPNTMLSNLFSKKVRKNLLDNYNIYEITNFGMDIFEEATVHTCIIGIQNSNEKTLTKIRKQVWTKEELQDETETVKLDGLVDKTTLAINVTLSNSESKLFSKLSEHKLLSEICHIRQCIKTGDDKKYVTKSETILTEPWKKTLRGKGINKYLIAETDLYLKYGDFLARNWQNKSFYETPKIAIRETGNQIIAALDLDNRYFLSTLYAIYPRNEYTIEYLKFLLGVLNSKIATFFVKKIAYDLTEGAFTKVRTNQLGRLPIPPNDKKISLLVDKIILKKQEGNDTSIEESQIEQLVYKLYDLTDEEIKVVEESVG